MCHNKLSSIAFLEVSVIYKMLHDYRIVENQTLFYYTIITIIYDEVRKGRKWSLCPIG